MASGYYLPSEIHSRILLRLPPESLIRFKSVCKAWYSEITHPNFISSHLTLQISAATRNPNLPLFLTEGYDQHSIWRNGQEIPNRTWLGSPWEIEGGFEFLAGGSCNGLVCMYSSTVREVFLWNPSIRKSIELEQIPIEDIFDDDEFLAVGFGFDSATNDYKVVAITYCDHLSYGDVMGQTPDPYAYVYCVTSGVWRSIGFPFHHCFEEDGDWNCLSDVQIPQAFFNGVIHWIVSRGIVAVSTNADGDVEDVVDDVGASILTFDVKNEVFGEFGLPWHLRDMDFAKVSIGVVKDSLAVFHWLDQECALFLMDEYGESEFWVRLFKIDLPGPCGRVLCLRSHDELLMIIGPGMLAFVDPYATQEAYNYHAYVCEFLGSAFPLIESLVLLDKGSKASWCEESEQV